jgi:acyl-CoA dehydrogenase
MINLELPKRLEAGANQARQVATQIFRPVSPSSSTRSRP